MPSTTPRRAKRRSAKTRRVWRPGRVVVPEPFHAHPKAWRKPLFTARDALALHPTWFSERADGFTAERLVEILEEHFRYAVDFHNMLSGKGNNQTKPFVDEQDEWLRGVRDATGQLIGLLGYDPDKFDPAEAEPPQAKWWHIISGGLSAFAEAPHLPEEHLNVARARYFASGDAERLGWQALHKHAAIYLLQQLPLALRALLDAATAERIRYLPLPEQRRGAPIDYFRGYVFRGLAIAHVEMFREQPVRAIDGDRSESLSAKWAQRILKRAAERAKAALPDRADAELFREASEMSLATIANRLADAADELADTAIRSSDAGPSS